MTKDDHPEECLHCEIGEVVQDWLTSRRCDGKIAINDLFRAASDIWAAGAGRPRPSRSDLHTILDLHLDESEREGRRYRSLN